MPDWLIVALVAAAGPALGLTVGLAIDRYARDEHGRRIRIFRGWR